MKKEEILKKAREEGSDEMEKSVQDKSMWWVFIAMGLCLIVFSLIRLENDQHPTDLAATISTGASAGFFYRYSRLHDGRNLFTAITTGICAIICIVLFILHH